MLRCRLILLNQSASCETVKPMALAGFSSVAERLFSAFSLCEIADWLMPARWATSFWDRPRWIRHTLARLRSFLMISSTTSWGIVSSSGTSFKYSRYGMTAKAGFPFCSMIYAFVCTLISFLTSSIYRIVSDSLKIIRQLPTLNR